MIITPTFTSGFDTNFGVNATAARAAWIAAAKVFTDAFSDPIHINITVDAVTKAGVFGESFPGFVSISYADLFNQVSRIRIHAKRCHRHRSWRLDDRRPIPPMASEPGS